MFYCRRWISLAGPSFAFLLITAPWFGVICHANLPQLASPQRNAAQFPSAVIDRAYLNSVHAEGRDIISHGEILAIRAFIHTRATYVFVRFLWDVTRNVKCQIWIPPQNCDNEIKIFALFVLPTFHFSAATHCTPQKKMREIWRAWGRERNKRK